LLAVAGALLLALPLRAGFKTGEALPDLTTYQLEGRLPEAWRGKVILLDLWASWCAPCKASFPVMDTLQKTYRDKGLLIIAVSVDEKRADMEKFLKANPVTFTVVRDAAQKLVAAAEVASMPTSFLIDRQGKIRFAHTGFRGTATTRKYQEEIEVLLKEPIPEAKP